MVTGDSGKRASTAGIAGKIRVEFKFVHNKRVQRLRDQIIGVKRVGANFEEDEDEDLSSDLELARDLTSFDFANAVLSSKSAKRWHARIAFNAKTTVKRLGGSIRQIGKNVALVRLGPNR